MPQDSGPESKKDTTMSAVSARLLEEVKAEPVPDTILELAQKLDRTLKLKRRSVSRD